VLFRFTFWACMCICVCACVNWVINKFFENCLNGKNRLNFLLSRGVGHLSSCQVENRFVVVRALWIYFWSSWFIYVCKSPSVLQRVFPPGYPATLRSPNSVTKVWAPFDCLCSWVYLSKFPVELCCVGFSFIGFITWMPEVELQ